MSVAASQELDGKVALVTGGTSGIGLAAADALVERGAAVVVCGHASADVEALDSRWGERALAVLADVRDEDAVSAVVEGAVGTFGRLDILVTAAGIQRYGNAADTDAPTWDDVFAVNVKGCFLAIKHALPHLRTSRSGAIVVVSSVQGHATQADVAAYTASKGALDALVRSVAIDEAVHGVRANSVCPGSVDTPMLRASARLFSDHSDAGVEATLQAWGAMHPLGRIAQPREVGEAIAFLAGPGASFITGTSLPVDGGLLAMLPVALP
jgi:NAD(P)-dependent dehydrogenase (short-subunit alcohol dehydrogenase family)